MSVSMAARALLYHRRADSGLVGTVYRQDPKKGAVFVDRVTVPIVDYASDELGRIPALDNAESGRYLVQLALPNGEVKTEGFDIIKGTDTKLIVDIPHEGPHEWSSLQALTGEFTAAGAGLEPEAFHRRVDADYVGRDYATLRQDPEHGFQLRLINLATAAASLLASDTLPRLAALIHRGAAVGEAEAGLGGGFEIEQPAKEDNDYALFEFVHAGSLGDGAGKGSFHFGPGSGIERAYLLEKSARGASLICLPAPWTKEGEETEIQLLLNKRTLGGEPDYTLTIGDPMINTALGYINNGALHEAARLVDFQTAKNLLFHKISSPLPATMGGYLLVLGLDRSAYKSRSDDWKNWIDNLYHWFEWLPDGAILRSALYFVLGDKDRNAAYNAVMTAYDRGLPYFTFGLNLMLEGMRRFANEGETAAKERLETLEVIARVTDPSQTFLTVEVSRQWRAG